MKIKVPVFQAGDYSKWGYSKYSNSDMKIIADRTNSFGVKPLNLFSDVYKLDSTGVPITFEHADTTGIVDAGYASKFIADDDKLLAELEIPDGVAENLKETDRGISIEIDPRSKIISRVTLTKKPLVEIAKFSEGSVSGLVKEENLELYSFMVAEEETIAEETIDAKEVEVEEVTEETVAEETVEDETVEETELEPQIEALSETEAMKSQIEQLQAEINRFKEEKLQAEIESFSVSAISDGIPPVIAKALAPYVVKGKEQFSKEATEFGSVAQGVLDFFKSDFKSKISGSGRDEYIRGDEVETFSADATIERVKKVAKDQNIEIGSDAYTKMLAVEAAKMKGE